MMQFRIYRFSCLASVAWAALMAPQAWAADEVFADAADAGIVVNGSPIRESMEASLEIQRESDNIVNAITADRSEEHTSELQSLMRISYAVFCLKKKTIQRQSRL